MVAVVSVDIKVRRANPQALARMKHRLVRNADQLAQDYADDVVSGSRRRVHVITGYLRSTIERQRLGYARYRAYVGAHYGIYEEYGTRYRPPHPYFRPSVVAARAQFRRNARRLFK